MQLPGDTFVGFVELRQALMDLKNVTLSFSNFFLGHADRIAWVRMLTARRTCGQLQLIKGLPDVLYVVSS